MSISIAIGSTSEELSKISTIKNIVGKEAEQTKDPKIIEVKEWIDDIYFILTDPSYLVQD